MTTERNLVVPQGSPDPIAQAIEAMRHDIAAIKDVVVGPFGKPEEGMAYQNAQTRQRVTALENQWGKVYALMSVPVAALLTIAVNYLYGGKH